MKISQNPPVASSEPPNGVLGDPATSLEASFPGVSDLLKLIELTHQAQREVDLTRISNGGVTWAGTSSFAIR